MGKGANAGKDSSANAGDSTASLLRKALHKLAGAAADGLAGLESNRSRTLRHLALGCPSDSVLEEEHQTQIDMSNAEAGALVAKTAKLIIEAAKELSAAVTSSSSSTAGGHLMSSSSLSTPAAGAGFGGPPAPPARVTFTPMADAPLTTPSGATAAESEEGRGKAKMSNAASSPRKGSRSNPSSPTSSSASASSPLGDGGGDSYSDSDDDDGGEEPMDNKASGGRRRRGLQQNDGEKEGNSSRRKRGASVASVASTTSVAKGGGQAARGFSTKGGTKKSDTSGSGPSSPKKRNASSTSVTLPAEGGGGGVGGSSSNKAAHKVASASNLKAEQQRLESLEGDLRRHKAAVEDYEASLCLLATSLGQLFAPTAERFDDCCGAFATRLIGPAGLRGGGGDKGNGSNAQLMRSRHASGTNLTLLAKQEGEEGDGGAPTVAFGAVTLPSQDVGGDCEDDTDTNNDSTSSSTASARPRKEPPPLAFRPDRDIGRASAGALAYASAIQNDLLDAAALGAVPSVLVDVATDTVMKVSALERACESLGLWAASDLPTAVALAKSESRALGAVRARHDERERAAEAVARAREVRLTAEADAAEKALAELEKSSGGSGSAKVGTFEEIAAATALLQKKKSDAAAAKKASSGSNSNSSDQSSAAKMGFTPTQKLEMGRGVNILIVMQCLHACARRVEKVSAAVSRRLPPKLEEATAMRAGSAQLFARFTDFVASSQQIMRSLLMPQQQQQKTLAFGGSSGNSNGSINSKLSQSQRSDGGGAVTLNPPPPPLLAGAVDYAALPTDLRQFLESSAISVSAVMSGVAASAASSTLSPPAPPAGSNNSSVTQLASALMTPPSASSLAPKTASAAETETPSSLNIQHQRAFLEACRLWISASRHMEKVLADAAKATAATADNAAKKKSFSRGGGGGEETATSGGGAAGGRRESTTSTISTQTPAANLAGTLGGGSSTANTGGTPPPNSILRKATLSNPSAVAVAVAAANKKTDDVGDVSPPFVPSGGGAALDADGLFILPFNLSNKMTQTALSAAHLSAAMAALSAQIAAGPPESRGGQEEKEEGPTESIEDRQKRRGERKSAVGEEEKEAMTQKKKNSTMSPAKGRSVAVTSKKSVVATTAANGNNNNKRAVVGANRGSAKKSAGGDGGNDHEAPPDTNTDITYNNLGEGGHEDDDEDDTIELYESAGDDSDASNAFASAGPSSQQHSPQHYPIADTSAHTISASSAAAPIVGSSRRTSQRRSVVLIEEPIHYSDSGKPHNQQQHQGEGGKKKEEGEGKAPAPAASPEYESLLSSGLHTHSPVIVSSIVPTPTAAQAGGAFSYYGTGGSPAIGKEGEGPLLLGAAAMPSHAGASAGSAPPSHSPSLSVSASSAHHLLRHHNSAGTVVSQVSSLIPTDGPTYRRATAAEGSGEALFGPSVASMHTSPVRKRRGEGGDTLPPHKVGEVVAIEENGEPKQREEEEEGRRGSSTDATTTTNNTSASNTPSTSSVTPHVKVSYRRSGKSVASSHNASANRSFASSSTTNLNNAANASTSSMTTTTTKITVRANASYLAPTASSRTKQSGTNLSEVARGLANVKRRDAIDDEGRVLHNMVSSEDYDEAVRRLAAAAEERDAAVAEVAKLRATVHQQQQPTQKDAASINNAALMLSSSSSSAAATAAAVTESPAAAALRLRVASLEEALKQQRAEMEKAALDADVAIKNANAAAAAAAASLLKAPAASRKRLATVVGRSGGGGGGAGSSSGEESSALHSSRSVEERLGGAGGGEQTLHVPPLQQAEGAPTNAPTNANANPQLQQQQLEGLPPASAFQRRRSFAASGINSNSGRGSNRGGRGGGGYHDEDLSLLQHLLHNPNPTAAAASGSNYGDAAAAEGTFGAFPMDPHDFDEEVNAEGGADNDDDEDRVVVDDVMILHSRVHELASMGLDSDNALVQRSAAMMEEYEACSNQQKQEQQEGGGGGAVAEAQRRLEGLELDLQMAKIAAAAAEKKAASSSSVGNAHSSQQQRASLSLSHPNLITSAATRAAGDFGSDATTATDSGASASPSLQQQQSHITALEARVAEAAGALRAAQQQGKQQQFPAAVPPRFGHSVMDVLVMSAELIMELLDHPATRAVFDEHKRRAAEGGVGGGGAGSTLPPFVLSGYQQQQQQRGARGGRVGDNPLGLHHHHHPNGHSALKATLEGSVLSNRAATSSTVAGAGGGTVDFIRSPREGSDSGGTSDGPLSMRTSTETLLPLMPNGSGKGGAATTSEAGGLLGRLHAILSPRSTLSTPAPSSSAGGVGSDTARRGLSSGSGFSADPLTATETAEGGGVAPDFGASPSRLAMKLRGEANSNAKKTAAAVGLRETIVIDLSTPPPSISADGAMMAATGAEGLLLAANTDEVAPPPSTVHGRRGESRETITLRGSRLPPRHQRYDNDNDQGSDDGSDFTSGSSSTSESGHHSGKEEMGSGGRRRRYRSPERNAAAALRRQERRRAAAEARPHFLKEEEGGTPQQSPTLFLADAAAVATEKTKRPNNSDASVPLPPPDYELEQFKRLREKRRGHDEATRAAKAAAEEKQQAERNAAAAVLLRARGAQQAAQRGGANRPTHHGSPVRGSHAAVLRHNAHHSPTIGSDANTSDHPRGEDGHNSGENTTSHSPRPYAAFADAEARRAANRSEASRLRAGFEALMVTPVPTAVGLRGAAAAAGGGGGRRGSPPLGPNLKPSEDTSQKKDECEGSDSPTNADDAAEQRRRLGIPPPTPEEELTRLRAFQLLSRHNAPLQPSTTAPTADGRPPIVPTSLLPAVAPNTAVSGTMRRLNAQHAKISAFGGGRDASAAAELLGDPTTGNEISAAAGGVMASPRGTLVLPPLHAAGAGIGPSAMTIRGGRAGAAGGGEQAFVLRPAPIEPTPMAALPAMLTRAQRSRAAKEREREKHAAVLHSSPSVHPTDGDADDSHQHSPNPLAAGTVAAPHADRRRLSPQPVQNFSATAPAALGNAAPQEEGGEEEGFASHNNNNGGGPAHAPFFVYALRTSHEAVAQRRASPARGRLAHETFASDPDYYHQSHNPTPITRGGGNNNNNSVGRSNNTTTPNANAAKFKSAPRRRSTSRVGNNDNNGKGRSTSVSASHTAATAPLPLSEGEGDSDFVRAQHRPSLQPSVAVGGLGLGIGGAPIPLLDVQPAQQPPTPSVALDPSRSAFAPKPSQIKGCNVYEHGQVPPTVSSGPDPLLLQSFLRGKPAPVNKGTLGGATKK